MKHSLLLILFLIGGLLSAETVKVQIYQTTDIHGMFTHDRRDAGALQQLSSKIRLFRREHPKTSLLIDCGDTIQGSQMASLTRGASSIAALKFLRYDAWIPGNHEFDFGLPRFLELSAEISDIAVCGNLYKDHRLLFPAWKVFRRNGAKIILIGATASYMKHWFAEVFSKDCQVELAVDMLKREMPEILKQKPDMIILAAHQAWEFRRSPRMVNEILKIAENFPEIDLILGGHTHIDYPGQKIGGHTWYLQAGYGARSLGVIEAEIDLKKHRVKKITSRLEFVDKNTPEDREFLQAMEPFYQIVERENRKRLTPPLQGTISPQGTPGIDNAASELFCRALVRQTGAAVAFHGPLSRKAFYKGRCITEKDLFAFVPYENDIVTAMLTAQEIQTVASEQWRQRRRYTYSGIHGAEARALRKNNRDCLELLSIGGKTVSLSDPTRYKVAMNSFMASGSGRYPLLRAILDRPSSLTVNTHISTRNALRLYLTQGQPLPFQPKAAIRR